MGLLDSVFGSDTSSAVPGGNTKPLIIALLALLASRYMSGGTKEASKETSAGPDVWAVFLRPLRTSRCHDAITGTMTSAQGRGYNSLFLA
jgi:hypothetical protein